MKFDTKVVRAGILPDPSTGAIVPPIYQSATYVLEEVGKDKGYDYTRASNPTREVLENNLAALDGGKYGICYASGMAANLLVNYDLSFTYVNSSNPQEVEEAIQENTKLIWIETPTNPLLKVTDLDAVGKIAKKHGILYGVDSTFSTPALLRPLEYGADITMHSTTKYLSGHNQIIGGVLITNNEELSEKFKFIQKTVGAVPSPFDCWLTLLGIKTLSLRMNRHCENAQAIGEFLESHPKVERVTYPGLPSHPQHDIAKEQMEGYSGMISMELKGGIPAGIALMNNLELCSLAESLGAVETMITHPATMTHADVPKEERLARGLTDGLVRLSVGIEDKDDIIGDLKQALEKV